MNDQDKLEKLARIEASNRARARRYLKRQRQDGKKQISAILTGPAYDELCRRRDQSINAGIPRSFGDIISALLVPELNTVDDDISKDIQNTLDDAAAILKPAEGHLPDDLEPGVDLEDYHGREQPDLGTKDQILIQLAHDLPGRKNAQARVDALNNAGITCAGAAWTSKKFTDNLRFAKQRQKKNY